MSDQVILELGSDFAIEAVNETLVPKIGSLEELNSLMKTIKYGYYNHEENKVETSGFHNFDKVWHLQAPETTIRYRAGICWDTVLVSKYYLNKLGYQTKMYYVEHVDDPNFKKSTHTFILYKELAGNAKNVKWHWYEWSWDEFKDNNLTYETDKDAYIDIAYKLSKDSGAPMKLYLCSGYPKIGCGPDTFHDLMIKKAKLLGICDANAHTFNPVPVDDKRNVKPAPPEQAQQPAQEDYMEKGIMTKAVYRTETVDDVMERIDFFAIRDLMRSYVDDTLSNNQCEHILRHYIGNCLQHQWWVRYFTDRLADEYYLNRTTTRGLVPPKYKRVIDQVLEHDSDKLTRLETIAAYSIRVYNQHWEEGMDEVHDLKINDEGKKAINEAWGYHVATQPHHPEHWDRHYDYHEKDLVKDPNSGKNVKASRMPEGYIIQMIGDWMAASLLLHKTAKGWFDKTVGTRFIFTTKQKNLMLDLLEFEDFLVKEVAGKNPFATEAFGVDANVVPADIKETNVVNGVPGVSRVSDGAITVKHVDPVTGKVVKTTTTNDHQSPAKKTDLPPSPEFDPNVVIGVEKYEPPYNAEQMRQNGYSEDTIKKLEADPVHKWRMDTGIELIHREPSKSELMRIWKNWQQMTSEQKKKSDAKCKELFGCDNKTLYDFLIVQYKTETPNKDDIEYPSAEDLAQEALGGSEKKSKKQRIIDYVTACMDLIDPTKENSKRFADFVGPMSDKELAQYIQNLKDHKCHIDIVMPNMKKHLQLNDVFAAAHKIDCKLFQRVWFYDMTTGKEFLSTEELPVFRLSVRRQEQMLDKKLSVPDGASKNDALTGQVTGDDAAGGFSMPEIQIMYSKGFKNVLKEFVKVRGGDVHAFADFERQLEEQGDGSMDQIKVNSRARSGAVLGTWLEAIHLDNNI